jgi:glucokinase
MHYLGIEIGGTKLQVGIGPDDGRLRGLWRGKVDLDAGPAGIRRQIVEAVPLALAEAGLSRDQVRGVGIGFGGPVDDRTRTVIKSHQIDGWDDFPLADWVSDAVELPAVLGNDADVAGLGEATHGAGKGLSPIFYMNIGSGIGGGLIIDGEIYRGVGRGAAEIGHLEMDEGKATRTLEELASGWGMEERYLSFTRSEERVAVPEIFRLANDGSLGNAHAQVVVMDATYYLARALCHIITLLCPRRIVIGGGVSLLGDQLFEPIRQNVAHLCFQPFAGLTDIIPAALGEEVVVHGAIRLARQKLGEQGGSP